MRLFTILAGCAALAAAVSSQGCGDGPATAVRLIIDFEGGLGIDQLALDVRVDGVSAFTARVPPTAGAPIPSGSDLVLLMDDRLVGRDVAAVVDGLAAGTAQARGEAAVPLEAGATVTVHVALAALIPCPDGQEACAGVCTDTQSDGRNCGRCGTVCPSGQTCTSGACVPNPCGDGKHPCDGVCYADTDVTHCGASCVTCTQPAAVCLDAATSRVYDATGTCTDGTCTFPYTDQSCPDGCAQGVCQGPTCTPGDWSLATADAGSAGFGNALAIDAAGGLHASYRRWADVRYAYRPANGSWSVATAVDVADGPELPTAIAVDGAGGVHIVYLDGLAGTVNYASKPANGQFTSAVIAVCDTPSAASQSQNTVGVTVDSQRGVHVVYLDQVNDEVRYASKPHGGTFTTSVAADAGGSGLGASIALDHQGGVHILFHGSGGVRHAYKPKDGTFTDAVVDSAGTNLPTSIQVDGADGVHVCYFGTWPNVPVKYAYQPAGGSWTIGVVDPGSSSQSTMGCSVALDGTGAPLVAYTDLVDDDLRVGWRTSTGTWLTEIVDGDGLTGEFPSLVVDADGGRHVTYYDFTDDALSYAYQPCL